MISLLKKKKTQPAAALTVQMTDAIRADFPILLNQKKPLIYFDNACMTLRPTQVICAITDYYTKYSSCAGRSNHRLSRELDLAVQLARESVARFIGAKHVDEIIFTRNATEGINLVANALKFEEGDIILTSHKEHNSNLVPWLKLVGDKSGVSVVHKIIPPTSDGEFSAENLQRELDLAKNDGKRVRLVSLGHISNVDGTHIDVADVVKRAHWYGALVLIDGCQAAGHIPLDVRTLDVDFYVFSAHKMFGPSGMGALYASRETQKSLGQFLVGGNTVVKTTYTSYESLQAPARFEAGLQDYAGILGFGAACDYIRKFGVDKIEQHVLGLNKLLTELLAAEIDGGQIKLLGSRDHALRGSVFSFVVPIMPQTEFASLLDKTYGIAVRAGQHCAHSWFNAVHIDGSVRISLHIYNTEDEIRQTAQAIRALLRLHGG